MGFTVWLVSNPQDQGRGSQKLSSAGLRSLKLFLLGLFLNNGSDWQHWRIPGVLQALAVAYFATTVTSLAGARLCRTTQTIKSRSATLSTAVVAVFVVVNLLVTFTLPVPGCPTGYIGPGGNKTTSSSLYEKDVSANCTGGAHLYVDLVVFGEQHIFQTPTCQNEFGTGPFDPEGLLNWLSVATTSLIGYRTAIAAVKFTPERGILPKSLAWASAALLGAGLALNTGLFGLARLIGLRWAGIPVNKNLWSLSFVLVCSGIASGFLYLVTVALNRISPSSRQGVWTYTRYPWMFVGTNSIAVYIMVRRHGFASHVL